MINNQRGPVDAVNPMPVTVVGGGVGGSSSGAYTPNTAFTGSNTGANGKGTLAAAATDYVAVVANPTRHGMTIFNTHPTATLIVNPAGLAWDGTNYVGIEIPPKTGWDWPAGSVPNAALHVASAVAGATYFIVEG